jgi:sterol 3beta-glucosyltransferase
MPSSGVIESHVALATRLILSAGHRVRIATHTKHRNLVAGGNKQLAGRRGKDGTRLEGRLEFFDVGGDPARLLPGLVGSESYTAVNILSYSHCAERRLIVSSATAPPREALQEILAALHRSAFYPDPTSGNHFAADAIIANPWAMAHVPIAASLGVPLVMSSGKPHLVPFLGCSPQR